MNLNQIKQSASNLYKNITGKSSFLAVAALILVGGFFAYRNFSSQSVLPEDLKIESSDLDGLSLDKETAINGGGTIAGGATGPEVKQQTFGIGAVAGAQDKKAVLKSGSSSASKWVARRMEKDSLKSDSSYKVQRGDTLWEIAKAKYGRGSEWTKILRANVDKVGFLPNGSQARIEIGQELALP